MIITSTLVLLIGYLVIDDIEYGQESIASHLSLLLLKRHSRIKGIDDQEHDGH
jgi:hypothetical protein